MSAKGSQVFDTVAEGSRREILDLLAAGPRPVGEIAARTGLSQPNASRHLRILREGGLGGARGVAEIAARTGLSQPNASRHLRILREAGLVEPRVDGQQRIYELRPAGLAELIGWGAPYPRLSQGKRGG